DNNLYTQTVAVNKVTGVATFTPQAQFNLVWAPGQSHTISAAFFDAQNVFQNAIPTPNPITQTVNKNTVSVGIVSPTTSSTTPVFAQTSTFTAIVTPIVTPNVTGASKPTAHVTIVLDPGVNQQ